MPAIAASCRWSMPGSSRSRRTPSPIARRRSRTSRASEGARRGRIVGLKGTCLDDDLSFDHLRLPAGLHLGLRSMARRDGLAVIGSPGHRQRVSRSGGSLDPWRPFRQPSDRGRPDSAGIPGARDTRDPRPVSGTAMEGGARPEQPGGAARARPDGGQAHARTRGWGPGTWSLRCSLSHPGWMRDESDWIRGDGGTTDLVLAADRPIVKGVRPGPVRLGTTWPDIAMASAEARAAASPRLKGCR